MKISTSSWHYRWVSRYYTAPDNLCPYVRRLMLVLLQHLIVFIFAIALGGVISLILISPIVYAINLHVWEFLPMGNKVFADTIWGFVLMGVSIYSLGLLWFLYDRAIDGMAKVFVRRHELHTTEPSIVSAWLSDIKNKTCTSIEFVDSKE